MKLSEYLLTAPHEEGEPTIRQIKAVLAYLRTHHTEYDLPSLSVKINVNKDETLFVSVGNGYKSHLYTVYFEDGVISDFKRIGTEIRD